MPRMDVGLSFHTDMMYRSLEFKGVSIEECPSTCFNQSTGRQRFCGTAPTACGSLECRSDCPDRYECWNNRCLSFRGMGDLSSLLANEEEARKAVEAKYN